MRAPQSGQMKAGPSSATGDGQAGEFGERVFPHGGARGRHGLPVPAVAARHHPGGRIPGHGGPAILAWEYRRPAHHGELPVAATIVLMNDSSQGVFLDLQNISLTGCRRSSPMSQRLNTQPHLHHI